MSTLTDAKLLRQGLEKAVKDNPHSVEHKLILADHLEDIGDRLGVLKLRVKAGVSEMCYKIRRKSDGLYWCSEHGDWYARGREWKSLGWPRCEIQALSDQGSGGRPPAFADGTLLSDIEIVLQEIRFTTIAVLPPEGDGVDGT